MEQPSSVLVPTICIDPSLPGKNPGREDLSGTDCPGVAQSDVVSLVAKQLGRCTNSASTHPGHCDKPYWPESSISSARSPGDAANLEVYQNELLTCCGNRGGHQRSSHIPLLGDNEPVGVLNGRQIQVQIYKQSP